MSQYGHYSESDYRRLMDRGWSGGLSDGTPCGSGSRIESTEAIRAILPDLFKRHDIRTVCDAGAGDLHWINLALDACTTPVDYQPFDLVPRQRNVRQIDIRAELLPSCDLILCRYVMGHMDPPGAIAALGNFRQSAKFLLATQHQPGQDVKQFNSYNHWDLSAEPFGLGEPVESHPDHKKSTLSLWRLS